MRRTAEQLYAEIRRLPAGQQRELLARLRRDLERDAAHTAAPPRPVAVPRTAPPVPGARGETCLLIDGCNLLGVLPDFHLGAPADHERLVFLLQDYAQRYPRLRILLFMDGQRVRRYQHGAIHIRYTAGRPADDALVEFLASLPPEDRRRARVVTADGELTRRVRALGARVEAPMAFYRRLARADPEVDERDRPLSPAEVEEWAAYFGLTEEG